MTTTLGNYATVDSELHCSTTVLALIAYREARLCQASVKYVGQQHYSAPDINNDCAAAATTGAKSA